MTPEEMREITRRFALDPWGKGDFSVFDEVCAPDYTLGGNQSLDDLKKAVALTRQAVPNLQVSIGETIIEGDKVAYRWTMEGTHEGEFQGIPPTHKPVKATGITILHFVNGKIAHDEFESSSPPFEAQIS